MIQLILPYPLSANRYWHPVKLGAHISIVPTREAKAYRKDIAERCRGVPMVKGRCAFEVWLFPNRPQDWAKRQRQMGSSWDDTVMCIDLDNANKVLLDALKGVAIEDDKWVRRIVAQRMEPDQHGARVIVRIIPITVEQPQMALVAA